MLETLQPVERAVFVLREVFDLAYEEIAEAVGKSQAAVRQLAHWARTHVTARRPHGTGSPALLIRLDGEIDGVLAVHVDNGHVTGAYHVRNPEKLSHINRPTTVSR